MKHSTSHILPMQQSPPRKGLDRQTAHACGVQKDGEIALFGGEYFDSATDRQLVYGDLFIFNCSKERWRRVVVPNRCS